jgi:acetyl esterase
MHLSVTAHAPVVLEPESQAFVEATSTPPFIYELTPASARKVLDAYAARLRAAGVPVTTVRYDGITHDFMMLNPLSGTHATRAAVAQAIAFLREALDSA